MLLQNFAQGCINRLATWGFDVIEKAFLDALHQSLNTLRIVFNTVFAESILCALDQASLNLVANVDTQSPTSLPVKGKNQHLLSGFPQINNLANCRMDFWVSGATALFER